MNDLLSRALMGALTGASSAIAREAVNAQTVSAPANTRVELEIIPRTSDAPQCDHVSRQGERCTSIARVLVTGDLMTPQALCPWDTLMVLYHFMFPLPRS